MDYICRKIGAQARKAISRGKSLLLLGPRQTGKTTFVRTELQPDLEISFVKRTDRLRYEKNPELLEAELENFIASFKSGEKPLIFIDEVQKVPQVMDSLQYILDKKQAIFIISGSSARKLKHGKDINLLPGRVVVLVMNGFLYQELQEVQKLKGLSVTIEDLLIYGSLPAIVLEPDKENKEIDLSSYVTSYLEDEIRQEAVVRNVGQFAQFLQFAAGESGKQINYAKISQEIGVAATTIANYFQILVDCLVAVKIEPITRSRTNRRLIKAARYLFFDLGIRRLCANEGTKLPANTLGDLFEQFVGIQLNNYAAIFNPQIKLKYWRDSSGLEIDYVLEINKQYIPIEVKYKAAPSNKDVKNIEKFLLEYLEVKNAYIISNSPKEYTLGKKGNIKVISWQQLDKIFADISL